MKSSKRKIIIGGIVAVLGIALLAYVAHVLTAALDSKPGDVSKAQFVVQLGADEMPTNVTADRTLTLDFGEPFKHAPTAARCRSSSPLPMCTPLKTPEARS